MKARTIFEVLFLLLFAASTLFAFHHFWPGIVGMLIGALGALESRFELSELAADYYHKRGRWQEWEELPPEEPKEDEEEDDVAYNEDNFKFYR